MPQYPGHRFSQSAEGRLNSGVTDGDQVPFPLTPVDNSVTFAGKLNSEHPVAPRKKAFDFEQNLARLEELVTALESGSLSLEDSLKAFEQGIGITRECQTALKTAQQKIETLTRTPDNQLEADAFEPADDD